MRIDLSIQAERGFALPVMPVTTYSSSALPVEVTGLPARIIGGEVSEVSITVVNADGAPVTARAFRSCGGWAALFAGLNFEHYGDVRRGVRIQATVVHPDGSTATVTVGVADLWILPVGEGAVKGSPAVSYVTKGSDVYLKSEVVDGVQHYLKQKMVHDPDIGWGAVWTGDYILSAEGEYVEVAR